LKWGGIFMAGSLKVSLVVLSGMVFALSACNQISNRSMATPTITNPSSPQSKSAAAKYSTATQQKQSQDKSKATESQRGDYKPVSLAEIEKAKASTGSDPKAVALSVFGNTDSEGGSREVKVDYPQPDQAIVTITQTGVADDSIAAIRYRVELLSKNSSPATNSWKIVWAGSQFKCQQGRGHQDWSTKLCS
jgi:hypothetical protein